LITFIADEFETPTKKKKQDNGEDNRKSRIIPPKVADESETVTKKKKQDEKEAKKKSSPLSPKVIYIYITCPFL